MAAETQASGLVERALDAYFDAMRAIDQEAWVAAFSTDGRLEPAGGPQVAGRDGLRRFFRATFCTFDKVEMIVELAVVSGLGAAAHWRGAWRTVDGEDLALRGIDVIDVTPDGKIRRARSWWISPPTAAQAIGPDTAGTRPLH